MRIGIGWELVVASSALAILAALPHELGAQAPTGVVEGRVTEAASGRPLDNAQVSIVGTNLGGATNETGAFRITGVPVRQVEIRARRIGYAPGTQSALVVAGQTVRADFGLQVSILQLEQIVVTGSGQQVEVKRLGNTVAVIQPQANVPVRDISTLLAAREPGLSAITSAGLTGEGARIRIRGNASLTQSNEPVIFIDGIRINNGGARTSRLDDIDPSTIERVEILKGAAAATLYGTEASNGVIQIFTKMGSAGAPRWRFSLDQEAIQFPNRVPPNAGYARTQGQADSLATFWNRPGLQPFQVFEVPIWNDYFRETGTASTLAAQVSGGGQSMTYFASGRYQYENGPIGGEAIGPAQDALRRIQTSLNFTLVPISNVRLGFRTAYYNIWSAIPGGGIIGNSIYGTYALSQYARPEAANCIKSTYVSPGRCSGPGNPFGNSAFMTIRESLQQVTEETINRYNGALSATYTPSSELNVDLTAGWDVSNRRRFDFSRFRYDIDEYTLNNVEGSRSVGESQARVLTLDSKAAWNRPITPSVSSALVVGMQVFNDRVENSSGSSTNLPGPGIGVVGAGGANITVGEGFQTAINGGYFAQEQLGFRDWTFLTVGGRYDFASAFGEDAPGVWYPKASLSVIPSELGAWSSPLGISTLRLRAAWGRSGRQPGGFDKFTTFAPLRSELGAGLVPSQLGNQNLKPEIATEIEGGFEAGLLDERLGLSATAWQRTVDDLLIARQFAVSGGFRQSQLDNIGEIDANGYELGLQAVALNRPDLWIGFNASAAYLKQTVVSLGATNSIKTNPGYVRHRVFLKTGDPLGSIYVPRIASACPGGGTTPAKNKLGADIACFGPGQFPISLNGNGRAATQAELLAYLAQPRDLKTSAVQNALRPLLADYDGSGNLFEQRIGDIFPDWTGTFGSDVTFRRNWQLHALFEWRNGFMVHNLTHAFRGGQHATLGSNLRDYAEVEATLLNPASTPDERLAAANTYILHHRRLLEPGLSEFEDGKFLRFNELSLTYNASPEMARRVGASSLSVTLSGRNLALWTNYTGSDPEITYAGREPGGGVQANFNDSNDSFGMPIPRRYALRVNVGY
jgi:TonB-linked SusC/RagA family outer membrane protein